MTTCQKPLQFKSKQKIENKTLFLNTPEQHVDFVQRVTRVAYIKYPPLLTNTIRRLSTRAFCCQKS